VRIVTTVLFAVTEQATWIERLWSRCWQACWNCCR